MTDPILNPEYVAAVTHLVNRSPYFSLLSMTIEKLTWGASVLEIDLGDKHLQPLGMVHGGVFASLVDAAAFWAVFTQLEDEMGLTTVEIKLNYLAPARAGRLRARGRSIKVGKTLGLGEAQVDDDEGRLLAHGTSTMMCLPQRHIEGHEDLPPKVL
jgi:uncharacterized protein (TIGR00369 family)